MRTRISEGMRTIAGLALIATAFIGAPVQGEDPPPPDTAFTIEVSAKNTSLQIVEKTSRVLEFKNRVRSVDGYDSTVLKVTAPDDPHHIRVQAITPGITNLVIVDETASTFNVEVLVIGDVRQLEALIKNQFKDANVKAVKIRDSVLLTGAVNKPEDIPTIIQIAEQFHPSVLNSLHVTGVQQVLLKVQVMEVQRGKIRQMGFNYWLNGLRGNRTNIFSTPGNLLPIGSYASTVGGSASVTASTSAVSSPTAIMHIASNDATLDGFIEALQDETLLKVLAEPNLMTVNGRPADFLSGGEFPILIPQGIGTATVAFRQFGTQLVFVPQVLSNGRLRMDVAPEVSERDFTSSIVLNGFTVPGIKTRRMNTQVEMNFGETLIIGGLISTNIIAETHKVPFLGELPWVGAAFRRVKYNEAETELLILVTPEYVAPLEEGQVPPGRPGLNTTTPTARELYIDGRLEVRRYDGDCPLPAMDNSPGGYGVTVPPPVPAPPMPTSSSGSGSTPPSETSQPAATTQSVSTKVPDPLPAESRTKTKAVSPASKPVVKELPQLIGPQSNESVTTEETAPPAKPNADGDLPPAEPNLESSWLKKSSNNVVRRQSPAKTVVTPLGRPTSKAKPGLIDPVSGSSVQVKSSLRPGLIEP